jgi:hypothetical protein
MNGDNQATMASAFSDAGKFPKKVTIIPEQPNDSYQPDDVIEGWEGLDADDKARKEAILNEHFPKALERFNAGVSLTKIRQHYQKLGAKYSPVTFRKKWEELVKKNSKQV